MRKTSSTIGLIVMVTTLLAACSSPESDGRQTAQAYIQCRETLKADLQKAQDNFVGNFDPKNYQSRGAAFDAYQEQVGQCEKTYGENVGNADRRDAECRQKYVKNEAAYDAYRDAVDEGLKDDTIDVVTLFASALHAPAVLRAIRQIVPPLPSDEKLVADLSERAISEGYEDGYFSKNQ
ncbi:MAG: hypothetical protein IJ680_00295, partial [Paludibacteraceae bacterium]|nr:hypothetical protein [Paludibacteraceae bacterium]